MTIAKDNEILINPSDEQYLKTKVSVNGKLNYENVIKDLALIAVPEGFDINTLIPQGNAGVVEDV